MSALNFTESETHPPDLSVELQEVDNAEGIGSEGPHSLAAGGGSGSASSGGNGTSSLVETLLYIDYHLGLIPFRLSGSSSGISDCIVKAIFTFINICSLLHIILQIRLLAVFLDDDGGKKENTFWFIAIGYQIAVMLVQLRYAYLLLCKQARFMNLAALLRATKLTQHWHLKKTRIISMVLRLSSLATCTATVFGGFNVIVRGEKWSFRRILQYHETEIYFSIESLVPQSDFARNETTAGLLFNNLDLDELILGGTGIALEYIHQILNSCTHDFFLVSTITLWLYMRGVRRELKGAKVNQAEYTCAEYKTLVDDHEELQKISKQVNEILKLFLPAMTLTNIIMASYFTRICFHREWLRAVPYALKLGKIGFTYMLAMDISDYEDSFNQWYMSQKLPSRLGLDVISAQVKLSEMRHQHHVGIGKGIFYIDTRFICSFAGITSSYFFIVTEALAERGCNCA